MKTEQEKQAATIIREVASLLRSLKKQIADDYRASDDVDDNRPGMSVTIGTNDMISWTYQTGDNSYSGSCYSCKSWGVISLYRNSNCLELAKQAVDEMAEAHYSLTA